MARYTDSVCRLCRREGEKLFLKGSRCTTNKCSFEKRGFPPGQHGKNRRFKRSEFWTQLREKQKAKQLYGLLERQFRNTFKKAEQEKGITGENLLKRLERRLDNVVFRLGFAPSRIAARQLIRHRHVQVNGGIVDIPSFQVSRGDRVKIQDKSRKMILIHDSLRRQREGMLVPWLTVDKANLTGEMLDIPERADIPVNIKENLIVELYSK